MKDKSVMRKNIATIDTYEYEGIPAETIKNLLCVDFKGAYSETFAFDALFTPQQLMFCLLDELGYTQQAKELEEAAYAEDSLIECISNKKGGCFLHARYKIGAQSTVFYIATNVQIESDIDGNTVCAAKSYAILGGVEDIDIENNMIFYPFTSMSLAIINDEGDDYLLTPINRREFYASLCYAQQTVATCLAGDALDLEMQQYLLTPDEIDRSYESFTTLIGKMSTREVVDEYMNRFAGKSSNPEPSSVRTDLSPFAKRQLN